MPISLYHFILILYSGVSTKFVDFGVILCYHMWYQYFMIFYELGNGAKQSFISPRLATLYFTTRGKSFSR